jgi:hypothetical protein
MDNPITLIEAHQKRVDKMNGELDFPSNGMSIDLLRAVYRNPSIPLPVRMRAAISCLQHETPKLGVSVMVNEQDFASLLDARIKRYEEMQARTIEAKPQPQTIEQPIDPPQIEPYRSHPITTDRRFRRM